MNKLNEIRKANAIAASSLTALGPVPATRVLREHLLTVLEWRGRGASWDQIAAILNEAGWRSKTGGIVSSQVLRATVSRIGRSQPKQFRPVNVRTDRVAPAGSKPPSASETSGVNPANSAIAERIRRAAVLRSGKDEG